MSIIKSDRDSDQAPAVKSCPHNSQVSCGDCRLGAICLPLALEDDEIVKLDEVVQRGRPLQKGDHIFRDGDKFGSIYAVRSGAIKSYRVTGDGEEQVTGFYFPGEIIGMDGISRDKYVTSAKALETSAVCEIPFTSLEELSIQFPMLQRHFFQLMSSEIAVDQKVITLLSKNTAEQRVAALLMSISLRNARRKLSRTQFRLPMSRTDIGNFLGLTIETVSRILSRFGKQGLIKVEKKEVTLLDVEALKEMTSMDTDF
jgi:CRP/FNR family transcriptional regulator